MIVPHYDPGAVLMRLGICEMELFGRQQDIAELQQQVADLEREIEAARKTIAAMSTANEHPPDC